MSGFLNSVKVRRALGAVVAAGVVNGATLLALAALNGGGVAEPEAREEMRVMMVADRKPPEVERPKPVPKPVEEERVMEVSLDMPAEPVVRARPVEVKLDLSVPSVSPVRVAVAREAKETVARQSVTESVAEAEPMSSDRVDQPPRAVESTPPAYPRSALRRGVEGAVRVRMLIDEAGRVVEVRVVEVEGYDRFGEAVVDAVGGWRFEPARHGGRAVKVWASKTIRFEIGR